MIRVFYGDDRVRAMKEVQRILGDDYEVVEGGDLTTGDLPSLFMGQSLLTMGEARRILVRDISGNLAVWEKLAKYVETKHEVILLETKIDKRTVGYKVLEKAGVGFQEFKLPEQKDTRTVFDILETALRDGKRAVKMLREIEGEQDPYMLVGLFATQAVKKFSYGQSERDRRLLKELAKLDLEMKESVLAGEPWLLVEGWILRLGSAVGGLIGVGKL